MFLSISLIVTFLQRNLLQSSNLPKGKPALQNPKCFRAPVWLLPRAADIGQPEWLTSGQRPWIATATRAQGIVTALKDWARV
jgi:hypothetical protein